MSDAIDRSWSDLSKFYLLALEADTQRTIRPQFPDAAQEQLYDQAKSPIPVLRIGPHLAGLDPETQFSAVGGWVDQVAIRPGSEVQIDYDCPTSKLRDYADLLVRLADQCSDLRFSITALPTWLETDDFAAVAGAISNGILISALLPSL